MTPKQQRFVEEYLIDLNATQAAIRAGYSEKTAAQIGAENLIKPVVASAIASAQDARSSRTKITQDDVLQELARIGFSDMRTFANWGPRGVTLKSVEELDDDASRCVAEVSQTISKEGGSIRFKLHDKPTALINIGKHLGMFSDKADSSLTEIPKLSDDELTKRRKSLKLA
jgi:phage terminase small subunit